MLSRRRLLASAGSAGALTLVGGIARPYLSRAADRPRITHGIQSGDVSTNSAVVWARADRPARLRVELATSDRFDKILAARYRWTPRPTATSPQRRCSMDCPRGQDIFYRASFEDRGISPARGSAGRALSHRAARSSLDLVRMVGRHRRPGLGHRRGARRLSHLRDDAAQPSRFLHPLRRQHLRRLPDRRRADACATARSGATS